MAGEISEDPRSDACRRRLADLHKGDAVAILATARNTAAGGTVDQISSAELSQYYRLLPAPVRP